MNFEEAFKLIDSIPGWMQEDECRFLFDTARSCAAAGDIVELGSYLGRSTAALCLGSLSVSPPNLATLVYTVDPFTAWAGVPPKDKDLPGPNWTYPAFIENMRRLNLMSVVRPLVCTSMQAHVNWNMPIKFLFIDANHDYASVRHDLDMWAPHVTKGGIIALHDTLTWEGPKKVVQEEWKGREVVRVGEICAVQKM